METVEEFMHRFYAERAKVVCIVEKINIPFWESFFDEEYVEARIREGDRLLVYNKLIPYNLLRVEVKNDTAIVITSEPIGNNLERRIYYLRLTGANWRIYKKGSECFICKGNGADEGEVCSCCNGKGWTFYGPSAKS